MTNNYWEWWLLKFAHSENLKPYKGKGVKFVSEIINVKLVKSA